MPLECFSGKARPELLVWLPRKVRVLAGPFEDLELRLTGEEKSLAGPIEMIPELDGTRYQGTEHVLLDILDTKQGRTAGLRLELPE